MGITKRQEDGRRDIGPRVSSAGNQANHRLLYNPGEAAIVVFKIDDAKDGTSD
jgi:hypothetical protein